MHKHAARQLHYDFRLEIDGVLKSWAVPKGPSLNPADKHLAIRVEDHPYDYKDFEGVIAPGNYGAGTVMIWDEGTYIPINEKEEPISEKRLLEELHKGKISFLLKGHKLKGHFSLIKMKGSSSQDHWLLAKAKDAFASTEDILMRDRSVKSDHTMGEIV